MRLIHDKNAVSSCFSHVLGAQAPYLFSVQRFAVGRRNASFLAFGAMLVFPLSLSCTSTWVIRTRTVQGRYKHRRGVLALSIVTPAGHGLGAAWSLRRLFVP